MPKATNYALDLNHTHMHGHVYARDLSCKRKLEYAERHSSCVSSRSDVQAVGCDKPLKELNHIEYHFM